jgi:thiol:disulfide interchange protein DsbD
VALVGAGGTEAVAAHGLEFERIKTVEELEARVAAADEQGRGVMLDFYADWCISCKEMEKYTFTDPRVQQSLADTVLLQADVTANDAADKALLRHFDLIGPPAILFFGEDGEERRPFRVVGFMAAADFADRVDLAMR